MRLLGLAQVDPRVPTTAPGASSKFLFDTLARRHELVARHGVDLTRAQRGLLAALERAAGARPGRFRRGSAERVASS